MMPRLLIVDDEANITDGLYEFFMRDQAADLDIIKAYSTSEALEWLTEVKVDVVLSDVCMPKMNGLELIREIEIGWPRCKAVLLTGFNEFEYAHQAIRSPIVVDYLLKTESMDRIRDTVMHAFRLVQEELEVSHQRILVKEKMPKVLYALQSQFLKDILRSDYGLLRIEQASFDALQMRLRAKQTVLIAVLSVEEWGKYQKVEDQRLIAFSVANIAEELIGAIAMVKCADIDSMTIACAIQMDPNDWDVGLAQHEQRLLKKVHGTLETLQESCGSYLSVAVSVALSDRFVEWPQACKALNRLQLALLQGPENGMEKWMLVPLSEAEPYEDEGGSRKKTALYAVEQVFQSLLNQDGPEADRHFRQFCEVYTASGPDDPFDKMQILHALSHQLLVAIDMLKLKGELQEEGLALLQFDSRIDWANAIKLLHRWIRRIKELRLGGGSAIEQGVPLLGTIHQYIQTHLEHDLSLTTIAKRVALNPSYLSRWYKKNTGEAITDYMNRIKINKAKELLASSDLKIHEISAKLGFADAHYFFRFFKKTMKCTPNEYRDRAQ